MAKFLLTNWETVPFKKKSFEGQPDRFIKVCVASIDNPKQVLAIIPLFGIDERYIKIVHDYELGKRELPSYFNIPYDGEFEEVKSEHGPLYRVFTPDEAKYGICSPNEVGKVERLPNGKVKIYHSIRVFCRFYVNKLGKQYLNGWFPTQLYQRYFDYSYHRLSDLIEPLQI